MKSTLRREFDVSFALDALQGARRHRRQICLCQLGAPGWRYLADGPKTPCKTRCRIPSPRGDKNGADINLALDALEMAFTHTHVNAFAIVSGDSDFIPLVNKLKEYGKTVFVVGGKAFTSTILQQNCHEFISFESLLSDTSVPASVAALEVRAIHQQRPRSDRPERGDRQQGDRPPQGDRQQGDRGGRRERPAPLDLVQAMPLVERALQVLERRGVQPQLGLLKSTMLQLDSAFNERAYGGSSFSDFVEKLKRADLVNVSGTGGRYVIERKGSASTEHPSLKHEDLLPPLRDVLENHRLEIENGCPVEDLAGWFKLEQPNFDVAAYGFQQFTEFLNYAQDKTVVRLEPHEDQGHAVLGLLGAEFFPPALPPAPEPEAVEEEEEVEVYEPQPYVEGQPTIFEPNPPPAKPKRAPARKRISKPAAGGGGGQRRPVRRKKTDK